jgi:hypothetical protein
MHRAPWTAALAISLFALPLLPAQTSTADTPIARALSPFRGFDLDGNGIPEIRTVELMHEAGAAKAPLAVVLVEARLLRPEAGVPAERLAELRERLLRHAGDLAAEGFHTAVLTLDVHTGPPHQDGRTVLALRSLLRALHDAAGPLTHTVLVGHFPDALLVRTCNWRRNEALQLPGRDGKPVAIAPNETNVRSVPEYVAHRCDVVLGDLDGAWDGVYVAGPAALPSVTSVAGGEGAACKGIATGELRVVDVFNVRDGTATVDKEAFRVVIDDADRDHECASSDKTTGNPLARPEVAISRIDARGVAWSPEGKALDGAGKPQVVALAEGDASKDVRWVRDAGLERRLLVEYFDRNHGFRTRKLPVEQDRPASISHGLGSGQDVLRAARPAWREFREVGYDCSEKVDLTQLLQWLQRPAVLRTLRAHSDPWGAAFDSSDIAAVERLAGTPWRWRRDGAQLVPSLAAHAGGRADAWFYRTLYENKVLPNVPFLMLHTGCEALSPPGACDVAYDDEGYGRFAHAEAMLFFTPCVAMVGRAKVFYDEPRGFCEVLGAGGTFGEAWQRYFAVEGAAVGWDEVGGDIGRKRAYFWSLVGDGTLRLPRS